MLVIILKVRRFRQTSRRQCCKMHLMNKIVYEINVDALAMYAFLLQFYLFLLLKGGSGGIRKILKVGAVSLLGVVMDGGSLLMGWYLTPFVIPLGMAVGMFFQMRLLFGKITFRGYGGLWKRRLGYFLSMGGLGTIYLTFAEKITVMGFWLYLQVTYLVLRKVFAVVEEREHIYCVRLYRGEETFCLNALYDTGNQLYEPISACPVCVIKGELFEKLLAAEKENFIRYVPYRSMGKTRGVLRAVAVSRMEILLDGTWQEKSGFYVAEGTPDTMSEQYDMILHEKVK